MASSAARAFLDQAPQFQLGLLPTECRHPDTLRLAELAQSDLRSALLTLQKVELDALTKLRNYRLEIEGISQSLRETLLAGGRIFFCGCGATGRLSLAIETLWREQTESDSTLKDKVFSFMAGGDFALIRSIENFEDHFDYGARQLRDAGFRDGDLLIATTEGGETPFVIGATDEATRISARKAVFLYCNPRDQLCQTAERSNRIIHHPGVRALSVDIGPMALAGSTRLQAASALMLVAGAALFSITERMSATEQIESYIQFFESSNVTLLEPFIQAEADTYRKNEFCIHRTDRYGITVVTDTTERTPTFSLLPFEASKTESIAWTYLTLTNTEEADAAWIRLLHRPPRPLSWNEMATKYGVDAIRAFDFSTHTIERRTQNGSMHVFDILDESHSIVFRFRGLEARFQKPLTLLSQHLHLKALLNFSSTLVMGRLGRYSSNLMLYVRPTNYKLIDRSIRFVKALLEDAGHADVSYQAICEHLFEIIPNARPDEPVVLLTFNALRKELGSAA